MENENTIMEKNIKKITRKQRRYEKMLEKNDYIKCVPFPTRFIFIGNAGLMCEIGCEELIIIFEPFGIIENIILLPNKSYSFIVFKRTEDAEMAMKQINGIKQEHIKYPLYLSYAENVPQNSNYFSIKELPSGLTIIEDFLSLEDEDELLQCIQWSNLDLQTLKHRKVKHFGYEFNYTTNKVDKENPLIEKIPEVCYKHLIRLLKNQYISRLPDQLTVNHYFPGQGIPSHIDTHSVFEDEIISVTLGSQVIMEFYHPDGHHIPILLPRCSVLIMKGESRYLWSHGIIPRKVDIVPFHSNENIYLKSVRRDPRTSFTFRSICKQPCICDYPKQCDSQNKEEIGTKVEDYAKQLESVHVLQVYNKIAEHFSSTRHKEWPKVAKFLNNLPFGSLLIDAGCGNGKYLGKHSNLIEIGFDFSENLIKICQHNRVEVFVADNLQIPLRSEIADACISIAVLHHFATEEHRLNGIREIIRILCKSGKALIYVWAMEQKRPEGSSNYLKSSREKCIKSDEITNLNDRDKLEYTSSNTILPIHVNRTEFEQQDIFVPWHKTKNVNEKQDETPIYHRYYHVFVKGELENLIKKVKDAKIIESYYDQGNWCVVIEKL